MNEPTVQEKTVRSVSVVVPVFNSESTLAELADGIGRVLDRPGSQLELLLVNDGSRDKSWEVIQELARRHPFVRGLNLMRNYGQHNALFAGIVRARHEIIVTMDDDLQHVPEDIPTLLDKLDEGFDAVYGIPCEEQHGLLRNIASRFTKFALQTAMNIPIAGDTSAFRAFRAQTMRPYAGFQGPFIDVDALLSWGTERFAAIEVPHQPRRHGRSNYSITSLMAHALNMITCFSTLPLRLVSALGFFFTLFGLGVLAWVVGRYLLEQGSEPGFPFLASIIALFSGAQLFGLGIVGEYLARSHFRSMGRPSSILRETTDAAERAAPDRSR